MEAQLPPRQLYEIRGEPAASLEEYKCLWEEGTEPPQSKGKRGAKQSKQPTLEPARRTREYNRAVLSFLSSADFVNAEREGAPIPTDLSLGGSGDGDAVSSAADLAAAHNSVLSLLSRKRPREAASTLAGLFVETAFGTSATARRGSDDAGGGESVPEEGTSTLVCRCAFLLMDCLLSSSLGDAGGLSSVAVAVPSVAARSAAAAGALFDDDDDVDGAEAKTKPGHARLTVTIDFLLSWVETFLEAVKADSASSSSAASELQFRLHLYKSRALSLRQPGPSSSAMKHDVKTRVARKELKSAMEIYQHKLNRWPPEDVSRDEVSVGSAVSDGGIPPTPSAAGRSSSSVAVGASATADDPPPAWVAARLEAQNQCALSLKANFEYLKGNPRKALKLCAEAKLAGERRRADGGAGGAGDGSNNAAVTAAPVTAAAGASATGSAVDLAMHHNNLALIHHASGRYHAALRYYAMALSCVENLPSRAGVSSSSSFERDGTLLHVPTAEILHNAALCAFAARNFACAYECMARCVGGGDAGGLDETYGGRARCWLRMAEGCIGMHADLRRKRRREDGMADNSGLALRRDASTDGVVINVSSAEQSRSPAASAKLASVLGSPEDVSQVSADPLPRALFCLQRALRLCQKSSSSAPDDADCRETAAVSLSYVYMELNDPMAALSMAGRVLNGDRPNGGDNARDENAMPLRRKATARLYSCEALCMLNEPQRAMRVMVGMDEGAGRPALSAEAVNGLAQQLAMLTPAEGRGSAKAAPSSSWERGRLEDARSSVHVTASGCAASVGNLREARAHAVQAMGEWSGGLDAPSGSAAVQYSGGAEAAANGARARRALLYCLLREGDCEGAVKLLRAGR